MSKTILRQPFSACLIVVLVIMIMALEPARNYAVFADNKLATATPIPTATPLAVVTSYDKIILLKPQSADAYLNRGNVLLIEDRINEAIADFNQAIKLDPKYPEAYFSRGVAFYKQTQYGLAIKDFTQAIEFNFKYAEAYYYRALALDEQDKVDSAIEDFTKTIQLNTTFTAEAYYYRGVIFAKQERFDLALQDLNQTIIINPQYAIAYAVRAQVLDEQGKLAEALKSYQLFLKMAGGPVSPAIVDRVKELEVILSDAIPTTSSGLITLDQTFIASDKSFSIQYPLGWKIQADTPYTVNIGNSAKTVHQLIKLLSPIFSSGDMGIQVNYISEDHMPSGVDVDVSGDPIRFLKSLLAYVPSTSNLGKFETYTLGTLHTARVTLKAVGIESIVYAFFVGDTPVYVVGVAAPGELAQFQPTLEAMILSLKINLPNKRQ